MCPPVWLAAATSTVNVDNILRIESQRGGRGEQPTSECGGMTLVMQTSVPPPRRREQTAYGKWNTIYLSIIELHAATCLTIPICVAHKFEANVNYTDSNTPPFVEECAIDTDTPASRQANHVGQLNRSLVPLVLVLSLSLSLRRRHAEDVCPGQPNKLHPEYC